MLFVGLGGLGSCVWCAEGWGHVFGALKAGVMCFFWVEGWGHVRCAEGWGHELFVGLSAGVMCLVG